MPAIVFLHGLLMSPDIWASAVARIGTRLQVMALWQPAHGGEPALARDAEMSGWARWLLGKLDAADVGDAVLVGHSMGGMLAMEFARLHPARVAGLLLVGTRARPWSTAEAAGPLQTAARFDRGFTSGELGEFARVLVDDAFLAAQPDWLDAWIRQGLANDGNGMGALMRILTRRPDPTPSLQALHRPIHIVHGDRDRAVAMRFAVQMATELEALLDIVPDTGHCPPLEAPEAFAGLVEAFLRTNRWVD